MNPRSYGQWWLVSLLRAQVTVALLGAVAIYASVSEGAAGQTRVIEFFINVVFVLGLQVYSGNSGLLSFGTMAFAAVGAYAAALLTVDPAIKSITSPALPHVLASTHLPFWPAAFIATAFTGLVAVIVGRPLGRLSRPSTTIALFAFLLIVNTLSTAWSGVTNGSGGLYGLPHATTILVAFCGAGGAVVVARVFKDSATGLKLRATRDDELSAAAMGVRVKAVQLRAFVLSGMLSAFAGVLQAHELTAISGDSFFLDQTFFVVAMLIFGGMASVSGAALGAGAITAAQLWLSGYEANGLRLGPIHLHQLTGLSDVVLVVLIFVVMFVRPEGVLGRLEVDELRLPRYRRPPRVAVKRLALRKLPKEPVTHRGVPDE